MTCCTFQPTPPAGAETPCRITPPHRTCYFNPLRPRGRRRTHSTQSTGSSLFQPTPPAGAETYNGVISAEAVVISTHSARGGGDSEEKPRFNNVFQISTHSARGGGDMAEAATSALNWIFQPTPPAGAETQIVAGLFMPICGFQPTPPAGAETLVTMFIRPPPGYFNPLRPRGRRRTLLGTEWHLICISTHSARGGGDDDHRDLAAQLGISTHSARGGGDRPAVQFDVRLLGFQPTPPAGAETQSPERRRSIRY